MRLEGVHHVTAITGDVLKNVDFYTRALGLRLVGKSVNQDDPSVYHVFFSDEHGRPGADITFFEYRGAARGRAGSGMVHRVLWRVTGEPALVFWEQRLAQEGGATKGGGGALAFCGPPRVAAARGGTGEPALLFGGGGLAKGGGATRGVGGSLGFADPGGLEHGLVGAPVPDEP